MNEKRFRIGLDDVYFNCIEDFVFDTELDCMIDNAEVLDLLNEQQSTIRKLQDLCGESDGENAKLRIENKELQEEIKLLKPTNIEQYEQIQKLQEENEQLHQKNTKLIAKIDFLERVIDGDV